VFCAFAVGATKGEPSECDADDVWDWFHLFISFGCSSPRFAARSSQRKFWGELKSGGLTHLALVFYVVGLGVQH
jgi:hypothetical protein